MRERKRERERESAPVTGLAMVSIGWYLASKFTTASLEGYDIRSFFKKKKDEDNKAQARLEEMEEEFSPVATRLGKRKVKRNEIM